MIENGEYQLMVPGRRELFFPQWGCNCYILGHKNMLRCGGVIRQVPAMPKVGKDDTWSKVQ